MPRQTRGSVAVFNHDGKIIKRLSKQAARRAVVVGKVHPLDRTLLTRGVALKKKSHERRTAVTLHEIAILKHKSFVVGGLTRTETNPAIKPYPVRFPATGGIVP